MVRLEPHEDQGMLVSLGAEFYPPAEPPAARARSRGRGRGRRRRAAALRRRPADHLRAESAAGQAQERRVSRKRSSETARVAAAHAPSAAPQEDRGKRMSIERIFPPSRSHSARALLARRARRRFHLCERAGPHRSGRPTSCRRAISSTKPIWCCHNIRRILDALRRQHGRCREVLRVSERRSRFRGR